MIVVGLSHQNTPLEVREKLAISKPAQRELLARLAALDMVSEVVFLSTCNRVEIYAATCDDDAALQAITRALVDIGGRKVGPHLLSQRGGSALKHMLRVASSLDSLVVGEPQILGQLKSAIRFAQANDTLGPQLSAALRCALHTAKKVRSETAIGVGQVSVPSVAVQLARQIFEDLAGKNALLVGAGEMAETAAKLIARAGGHIIVVNRSAARAEQLALGVDGCAKPWKSLDECLIRADIVVTSTASPVPVITKRQLKQIRRKRRGRSLFVIDIAVPRDVEPEVNDLDNVYLYDIDDLSHVVSQSVSDRQTEAGRAEAIVRRETLAFDKRVSQRAVKPLIVAMRSHVSGLLNAELKRSCRSRLKHLDDSDRAALETMLEAAVRKLMHAPTKNLKGLAAGPRRQEVAEVMTQLFELEDAVAEEVAREAARDGRVVDEVVGEAEPSAPGSKQIAAP